MFNIKKQIPILAIASLTLSGLTSCNKEIDAKKAINVTIRGYNISDKPLEVAVDTVVYDKNRLQPNSLVNFSMTYPYLSGKTEAQLRVSNTEGGKELFQQKLNLASGQLEFFYTLININGSLLELTPPPADSTTNKLGFYIHYPASNDPIDIFLTNLATGQMKYLAKNVTPQNWVYVDYLPEEGFMEKTDVSNCIIYFTKAGTTDQWAFNNDEYASQTWAHGTFLPHTKYNLNKVQSYFITPQQWQLDMIWLFPIPKEY